MNKHAVHCILVWIMISVSCHTAWSAVVRGQVNADSTWRQEVYLSLVPGFYAMNTASFEFLIGLGELDSLGQFAFHIDGLPEGEHLYRLHICKKGDPIPTIILGGKDENLIHFIMDSESDITFLAPKNEDLFGSIKMVDPSSNHQLQNIISLNKSKRIGNGLTSEQARQIANQNMVNTLAAYADTSSSTLVRLFAFHHLNHLADEQTFVQTHQKLSKYLDVVGDSTPYRQQFDLDYAFLTAGKNFPSALFIILLVPVIGLFYLGQKRRQISQTIKVNASEPQTLSRREQTVYDLLKTGKTNKEIASELHIEVSTVKSHVNKIYSKLGISNRNQIRRSL